MRSDRAIAEPPIGRQAKEGSLNQQLAVMGRDVAALSVSLGHLEPVQRDSLPETFGAFLDAAATATARATFYNTESEQRQTLDAVHQQLLAIDRGIYAAALLLPGVTDHMRQLGMSKLLSVTSDGPALLTEDQESAILRRLCAGLPPQRLLKVFGQLRASRVNNARTRKLILRTILRSGRLELWAVKYRRKLSAALQHAWGKRTASIVRSILAKPAAIRTPKERAILERQVGRFVEQPGCRGSVEECVGFALGNEENLTLPRLRAYRDA